MTTEGAAELWQAMQSRATPELSQTVAYAAVRYARIRTDWRLSDPDSRRAMDTSRTAAHNALIDACNILSRNMAQHGESIAWRKRLGDDRKVIGDFACHLHCLLGLEAR